MKATNDNPTTAPWRGKGPEAVVLGELVIRPALPEEMDRVCSSLENQHYFGVGRQVGRTLVQIVHHRQRWAAILAWGAAAMNSSTTTNGSVGPPASCSPISHFKENPDS